MREYLQATHFLDSESPAVRKFALESLGDAATDIDKAVRLFYAVRDGVRYNPYRFGIDTDTFVASHVLEAKEAFCVPKAVLLAAAARAVGIPARLGFADVRNHLSSPRLLEALRTDVFTFHGYSELYLEGKWLKATPAFNRSLCEKFGVAPLEFDGRTEAVFQPYDGEGKQFMEYLHDHGAFADLPVELMVASFRKHYPHFFDAAPPAAGGDLESDLS